ncbi:MAG TPA: sigma-70 family RNA polymerase sigma factor [Pseudonocardiaceae bacterium]|nr:sigma-70 family RNA polymerase sigma factor [Pseudonocardiaceae bacterium]
MTPEDAVAAAFRAEWGRLVATLIGATGDWELAEECAQDAFAKAVQRWPEEGVPRKPGAWLTTVARNRATDVLRRRGTEATKLRQFTVPEADPEQDIPDDRLRLMFTCCHPALAMDARIALTLRTLTGLTTAEIGRAFLVTEQTMAKRLVRAKNKIRNAGIPYRVPPAHQLPERTSGLLAVLCLLFNEGYAATSGPSALRVDLSAEAIRLTRALAGLMPDEPEVLGLLALMLLHNARNIGRTDEAGDLVLLPDQDRSRWDRAQIEEGFALLTSALRRGNVGQYQIQAAIAGAHARAESPEDTDWPQIARLYGHLATINPSPIVELNRAVAVAIADGPAAGLSILDTIDLPVYHLLPATRADLLRRLGRTSEAADAYRAALALPMSEAERRFLTTRLTELTGENHVPAGNRRS